MLFNTTRIGCLVALTLSSMNVFTQSVPSSSINTSTISLTNIDVPGAATTFALGINNSGDITGILLDSAGLATGYLADKQGHFVSAINFPGAAQTEPSGINEHGDIVGSYMDGSDFFHGFLLRNGDFLTIDFPGATANFPLDINDQGVIAGFYQDADLQDHGFTLDQAGFHAVDDPLQASPTTELMSINSKGDILGDFDFDTIGISHGAFLLTHGTFVPFTLSQATNGIFAQGLSNAGDIAGSFLGDDFIQHGFITSNGNLFVFDFPGALATAPIQLNSSRSAVGIYADAAVNAHSFLVTFDGSGTNADVTLPAGNALVQITAQADHTVLCGSVQHGLRSGSVNDGNHVCH